jgi:hypothetical protein
MLFSLQGNKILLQKIQKLLKKSQSISGSYNSIHHLMDFLTVTYHSSLKQLCPRTVGRFVSQMRSKLPPGMVFFTWYTLRQGTWYKRRTPYANRSGLSGHR